MVCNHDVENSHNLCNLRGISKVHRDVAVVHDVSFDIASGEVVALMGPSGVGKTTLLEIIAGESSPNCGAVFISADSLAYALQSAQLLPWRSVLDNVALAKEMRGEAIDVAREAATAVMRELGIVGWAELFPSALSGGMAQKVAIARTLCSDARLLLFDEPFSNMDVNSWRKFGKHIRIAASEGSGILIVTHQIDNVVDISDRILILRGAPATIDCTINVRGGCLWDTKSNQVTKSQHESREWLYSALTS